ncbi:unnamed protein product [Discosporangium mesarthrocarpum]
MFLRTWNPTTLPLSAEERHFEEGESNEKQKSKGKSTTKGSKHVGGSKGGKAGKRSTDVDKGLASSHASSAVALLKGPSGALLCDPGHPPPIFLLVSPSMKPLKPTKQLEGSGHSSEGNVMPLGGKGEGEGGDRADSDGGRKANDNGDGTRDGDGGELGGSGQGKEEPVAGKWEGSFDEQVVGGEGDNEGEVPHMEEEKETEDEGDAEEEEAELLTGLWVDQAAVEEGRAEVIPTTSAQVVLQEILPSTHQKKHTPSMLEDTQVGPLGGQIALRSRYVPGRGLPVSASSTKIRLLKGGRPRIFRMLLQPGLGCSVRFDSTHDIRTGEAPKARLGRVWQEAGHSQVTEAGSYSGARPGEWKVILRRVFWVRSDVTGMEGVDSMQEGTTRGSQKGSER